MNWTYFLICTTIFLGVPFGGMITMAAFDRPTVIKFIVVALIIGIVSTFIYKTWYELEAIEWNGGICPSCHNGNLEILNIQARGVDRLYFWKCDNCNHTIETWIDFTR